MMPQNCSLVTLSGCSERGTDMKTEAISAQVSKPNEFRDKLANVFTDAFDKFKKKLGFVKCHNGGKKTTEGVCECPPYYEGETCEELICVNNGTRVELPNKRFICKCAHPEYISGKHCELVRCDNNGQPQNNGYCRCLDYWYTGQFCESYTASWGAVIGVPLVCISAIIICCIICRLDFCPRRKSRRRHLGDLAESTSMHTGRWVHNVDDQMQQRRTFQQRNRDSALRLQENLLNENTLNGSHFPRTDSIAVPTYPIRLDTIPVFNPRMIGGVSERDVKFVEPPPSYEQAISLNFPQRLTTSSLNIGLPRPPDYTPIAFPASSGTVSSGF